MPNPSTLEQERQEEQGPHGSDSVTVDEIMAYENGDLDFDEICVMFQKLVNSGMAWQLQGSYGRVATALINEGHIQDNR